MQSILMKFSGFIYHVKDYCCANFCNQNCNFRKSLYFYIVDAGKKKKKNELRLGAGIILNQELTYSTHWRKMGCGRLPAP